jgi:alkylation response protein AidB-like acyl-CoA dehydrogenase
MASGGNKLESDPFFQRLLQRHLGGRYPDTAQRLRQLAEETETAFDQLVMETNRDENLPVVRRHDADGRPIEEVIFHPSYHEIGRIFWSSGALSVLAEAGNEVLSGALTYLLDQHGEAGHACPVACTSGAIKLIQQVGTTDQRERHLPALLESDSRLAKRAAQFVTEVQGGSDVGANTCIAVPESDRPGWFRIHGEKWFCSVADADLFVVSARLEDAPQGTKGLGLFLVPRMIDERPNGFRLRRLKYKLGTRSMATGEIEFDGALGEAVGAVDQGFRNLVGIVLDTSRVHNAIAACGIMRRAFVEAFHFASHRVAFDQRIIDFPAVAEILARMKLRTMAGLASTFRILSLTDRIDTEEVDDQLSAARRIAVMINKYWTALASTASARDGIEILGGNGTIEDFSVLPRLYRDAIVVESWEGTHNTLCAQVLRDFSARGLHEAWLRQLEIEIDGLADPKIHGHAERARRLYDDVAGHIQRLIAAAPGIAAAHVRHIVDRMCHLTDWVSLASQAQWELKQECASGTLDALELYRIVVLDRVDPLASGEFLELNARIASTL